MREYRFTALAGKAAEGIWGRIRKYGWYRRLRVKVKYFYKYVGLVLMRIGENMLHKKRKYRLICSIIEDVFRTNEIYLRVTSVRKFPLYLRFSVDIFSMSETVNWDYFKQELAMQLGCEMSDIAVVFDNKKYTVNITNTAVNNFQKGTMPYDPEGFEAESAEENRREKVLN